MRPGNKFFTIATAALLAAIAYGTWSAVRAKGNLVTLDVRNMDVRKVIAKIEWQTWESITVHKDVQGKVTLNVRRMPLEQVLRIVGDQTSSRWSALYPLYSGGRSLAAFKKALRGEADPAATGWTNLQNRGIAFGGNGGPGGGPVGGPRADFGGPGTGSNQLVTLQVYQKDVVFAALALNRFAQARVVPEDGTTAIVNLSLNKANVTDAIATLANKAHRSWARLYTLRGEFGPGGRERMAMRDPFGEEGGPSAEEREALRKQREALEEELRQTLSAEERLKLEQAGAQRDQQRQEMASLTPEQRRERMGQMGGPNMARQSLERIKNTTPEQRAEQRRQMAQRSPGGQPGRRPPGPR